MSRQRFKTTVVQAGTRTYVVIPFNPHEVWGAKQRHYVTGSINGRPIRGLLDSEATQFFLPLGAAWRRDNGVEVGAKVEVVLAPEGPQADALAPDIVVALDAEPQAKAFFDSLATFYRKNYVRWVESAKRPATRQKRIAEMVQLLKAGKKQR
ncbi:MAG: YdeI/OmpD-associated family protein [Abditibacteriales bacterium]|nr:YdeI/OmpD-associated family protein [Abditibacteriales bacterium]MDW8364936.1 YdeI/OmpD-associated family protein [Abditibacteriales bacterium]